MGAEDAQGRTTIQVPVRVDANDGNEKERKVKAEQPNRLLKLMDAIPPKIIPWIWLFCAIILTLLGAYGGEWFMRCEYVSGNGDQWAQYDGFNFFGLVLQTLCLPLAGISILGFALHSYKQPDWPVFLKLGSYLVVISLFIFAAQLSIRKYTAGLFSCLGSICVNGEDDDDGISAFKTSTAVYYVFACCGMIVVFGTLTFLIILDIVRGMKGRRREAVLRQPLVEEGELVSSALRNEHLTDAKLSSFEEKNARDRHVRKVTSIVLVVALLLPIIIFASMCVGDNWQHLTQSALKTYAASSVSDDYGQTWNWKLSDKLVLTLFGDILIFWVAIYLVIAVCLMSMHWPRLREFLFTRMKLPLQFGTWSIGEVLMLTLYLLLMLSEGLYWYIDHGWERADPDDTYDQERMARMLGQLASITMGLLVVPVQRNSIFQILLGVSWEGMIIYHRFMGTMFLLIIFMHMCFWWKVWDREGCFGHDWPIAIPMYYNEDNFTVPLAIITFWIMIVIYGIFALDYFRRNFFELFYYTHHFFLIVWVVILLHAASAWYYITGGLALFVIDRVLRLCSNVRRTRLVALTAISPANVTLVAFKVEGGSSRWPLLSLVQGKDDEPLNYEAGQFVFINVPAISVLQSHPITISSSPGDEVTTLHIRALGGPNSFTHQLYNLATEAHEQGSDLSKLTINIEGPFGLPFDYTKYQKVVFVAGGIGITPCHSIYRYLYHLAQEGTGAMGAGQDEGTCCSNVSLVWAAPDSALFTLFRDMLMLVKENSQDGRFSTDLYLTSGSINTSDFSVHGKRPDFTQLLQPFEPFRRKALVFFCGPADMGRAVSDVALQYGLSYHAETFEL